MFNWRHPDMNSALIQWFSTLEVNSLLRTIITEYGFTQIEEVISNLPVKIWIEEIPTFFESFRVTNATFHFELPEQFTEYDYLSQSPIRLSGSFTIDVLSTHRKLDGSYGQIPNFSENRKSTFVFQPEETNSTSSSHSAYRTTEFENANDHKFGNLMQSYGNGSSPFTIDSPYTNYNIVNILKNHKYPVVWSPVEMISGNSSQSSRITKTRFINHEVTSPIKHSNDDMGKSESVRHEVYMGLALGSQSETFKENCSTQQTDTSRIVEKKSTANEKEKEADHVKYAFYLIFTLIFFTYFCTMHYFLSKMCRPKLAACITVVIALLQLVVFLLYSI